MFQEIPIVLQNLWRATPTMTTPDKLKELEDITIDFNEYLRIVTENLKHLETGFQDIVSNIRTKIDELSKETT